MRFLSNYQYNFIMHAWKYTVTQYMFKAIGHGKCVSKI